MKIAVTTTITVTSDKPNRPVSFHALAKEITAREAGKREVDIAQVSEILSLTLDLLAETMLKNPHGVAHLLRKRMADVAKPDET